MAGMRPVKVFSLRIPPGAELIDANPGLPASVHITLASIDPDEKIGNGPARATLRIAHNVFDMIGSESDEDDMDSIDSDDLEGLKDDLEGMEDVLMADPLDDAKDNLAEPAASGSSSTKQTNGLHQLPPKSLQKSSLKNATKSSEDTKKAANGLKAEEVSSSPLDADDAHSHSDDGEHLEYVVCTLDPKLAYQVPLDITIRENEECYFRNTGGHTIYLNGNFVIALDDDNDDSQSDEDDDEDDEDGLMDMSDIYGNISDTDEEDLLDDISDPRVVEIDGEEEEQAPALASKAQKNRRPFKNGLPKKNGTSKLTEASPKVAQVKKETPNTKNIPVKQDITPQTLAVSIQPVLLPVAATGANEIAATGSKKSKRRARKRMANEMQANQTASTTTKTVSTTAAPSSSAPLDDTLSDAQVEAQKKRKRDGDELIAQPLGKKVQFDVKPEEELSKSAGKSIHAMDNVKDDNKKPTGDRFTGKQDNGKKFEANKRGKNSKLGSGKG